MMLVLEEERLPNAYLWYSTSTVSSSCEASLSEVVSSTLNHIGGARFLGQGTGWTGEFKLEVLMHVVLVHVVLVHVVLVHVVLVHVEGSPQWYLCICARYVSDM
jgi:hypothetical protein